MRDPEENNTKKTKMRDIGGNEIRKTKMRDLEENETRKTKMSDLEGNGTNKKKIMEMTSKIKQENVRNSDSGHATCTTGYPTGMPQGCGHVSSW